MSDQIDWDGLDGLAQTATRVGESVGTIPDNEWQKIETALVQLQTAEDWAGVVRLRKVFTGILARDSAWGISTIQRLDKAGIEAARCLGDMSDLGHFLGARGHNLHRQGFHKDAIIAFTESADSYYRIGDSFSRLKSLFMTSLCYRALGERTKARSILTEVLQQVELNNPWRGHPLQVLAWLTQDEGDLVGAEKLLCEALALFERMTNSDILIAGAMADLAEVAGLQGRWQEAVDTFQASLGIIDRHHGQYDRQEARTKLKYAELLIRRKQYDLALQLLDDADDKASGYGHYYDLMWRIELARTMIFIRKGKFRDAMLKAQMVIRYRHILGLSNWLLAKQLLTRYLAGTGLPR